ncbi:DUF484 family protein [Thaumasiovibrio subtropicus]|uniref:DUF484 family protein n=1 Tax=Thaumasiovibrio subtropicus TaxID=1891207 RepID=UPI000B35B7FB|nr:DUF484 family protein [Thaumasiovibrio subtropicus]
MTDSVPLSEEEQVQRERAAVAAYLQYDPEFFHHYPQLLETVRVPHQARGTVSLVDIQMDRLRQRVTDLEEEITGLMNQARRNETIFRCFGEAQMRLYEAENITQARRTLQTLAESLSLSVTLRLFTDPCQRHQLSRSEYQATRVSQLSQQSAYLGRLQRAEAELLFDQPPQLGSFAVLPVGEGQYQGILAFASADGGHFQPEMDTLFLSQLAALLTAQLPQWLADDIA